MTRKVRLILAGLMLAFGFLVLVNLFLLQRSQDRHLDEIARQYDLPKNDREFLEIYSKPFVGTDAGAILPELTRSYGEHYIRTRQGSAKPMSEEVDFQAIERYLRSDPDFLNMSRMFANADGLRPRRDRTQLDDPKDDDELKAMKSCELTLAKSGALLCRQGMGEEGIQDFARAAKVIEFCRSQSDLISQLVRVSNVIIWSRHATAALPSLARRPDLIRRLISISESMGDGDNQAVAKVEGYRWYKFFRNSDGKGSDEALARRAAALTVGPTVLEQDLRVFEAWASGDRMRAAKVDAEIRGESKPVGDLGVDLSPLEGLKLINTTDRARASKDLFRIGASAFLRGKAPDVANSVDLFTGNPYVVLRRGKDWLVASRGSEGDPVRFHDDDGTHKQRYLRFEFSGGMPTFRYR